MINYKISLIRIAAVNIYMIVEICIIFPCSKVGFLLLLNEAMK